MRKAAAGLRGRIAPILIFSLALFLRLFRLGLDGLGNLYYAAGVQSMLAGWHNFLFASFDPAGFVSIDKPPLGFWVQAVSVRLFGFHGWALILPQALAGALSTLVLYYLVKRTFGASAGLAAALILAVTPVSVATHRSNTPDGQLTLLLLLAAVCAVKAAESGRLRWLLGAAALVGLGFNVKMLQAYLVVPALFIFLPPPLPIFKRLGQLALAMLVLISISFAWPAFVDLTPASQRPYVGSTVTNHVYELAVVHNGVRRLGPIAAWLGIRARGAPPPAVAEVYSAGAAMPASQPISTRTWPDGGPPEVGQPGPLRLFNPQMAGQASWLLPIALAALITGLARSRWTQPLGGETLFYSLWAGWLIPALFFFSYGGLIHRYYLDMLAPPIAALTAAGLATWAVDLKAGRRTGWLLPAAVAVTAGIASYLLGYYPEAGWFALPVLALGLLTTALIILRRSRLAASHLIALSLSALLLAPLVWSTTPMWRGGDVILPYAGPDLVYWGGKGKVLDQYAQLTAALVNEHRGERFAAATENAVVAAPLQILSGLPVMAMGGFTGVDPILTVERLAEIAARGEVRFFLVYHSSSTAAGTVGWVAGHCTPVDWSSVPADMDLYDCAPR